MSEEPGSERKVVWILGAGFTRSLGAPLLPSLLSEASTHRVLHTYRDYFQGSDELIKDISMLYEAGAWGGPYCYRARPMMA